MNLPFVLPARKDAAPRKKEEAVKQGSSLELILERKLEQYRDNLEEYKRCIGEYSAKLDSYEKSASDNRLAYVQTAQEFNYLKEQEEKTVDLIYDLHRMAEEIKTEINNKSQSGIENTTASLENLKFKMEDLKLKMDGLDKTVISKMSELLLEMQKQTVYQNKQNQTELTSYLETLTQKVKKNQILLWISFILNLFGLGAFILMVLYIMEIIPFKF